MMSDRHCLICARQRSGPDGGPAVVCQDDHWLARHSAETDILGYLLLESRRHFLDLSQATEAELAGYGTLLSRLMRAMRAVTGCQRIYTVTLGEAVPHYHVHLIPRTESLPGAYRGRGILSYPLAPAADAGLVEETCLRLRRALRRQASTLSPP